MVSKRKLERAIRAQDALNSPEHHLPAMTIFVIAVTVTGIIFALLTLL